MELPRPAVFSDADTFVERVLLDGRFIDRFASEPQAVAGQLGVDLPDPALRHISTQSRSALLQHLFQSRFNPNTTRVHPYIVYESATAGVGFIIGGVVVGIAVVTIAVFAMARTKGIEDYSQGRERKL